MITGWVTLAWEGPEVLIPWTLQAPLDPDPILGSLGPTPPILLHTHTQR